jgi:N-carbamoylputrescine amidase
MRRTINVGLIQMACSDNVEENLDKAVEYVKVAASQGAHIVCLQELFKSRYFPQVVDGDLFNLAETIDEDNPTLQRLSGLAAELRIALVASLFERRALGLYHNTAVVLDADGSYLGMYRKMHIPEDPLYYEKFYFTPGDLGYRVFRTRYADVGVLICWDQWFPEAARLMALKGAEIIFCPTAIGYRRYEGETQIDKDYHDAWQMVQRGHAVANVCYVATVNRVGFESTPGTPEGKQGIDFWGQSFVSNPYGKVLKKASEDQEEVLVCPVDLSFIEKVRCKWSFPFRDRRVDSYGGLTELFLEG